MHRLTDHLDPHAAVLALVLIAGGLLAGGIFGGTLVFWGLCLLFMAWCIATAEPWPGDEN